MKKIMLFIVAVTTALVLSGCGQIQNLVDTQVSSANSLATLSYVSTSMLDTSVEDDSVVSGFGFMSEEDETEFESEIDEVNVYLDKLKVFIENGTSSLGNIEVQESDHEIYNNKITFTISEEEYILYYNVDLLDGTIVGEFIIGSVTYEIEGYTNFNDIDDIDLDDDDEDLDDDADLDDEEDLDEEEELDEEEQEEKMVLIARNGDDIIQITYKVETEDDEYEAKFELEQTINGVYKEITLKIEQEEDEYKIEIEDGENSYTLKREIEDDNEIEYKLEYEVNGVEGEVKVTETVNEAGETVYVYEIEEEGKRVERENGQPTSRGFDDDEDEEETEDEDESSDSSEL
ncbi:MAG: LptM family lipoprotein [Candidatus Izemoplasmataceae bacterium]